MKYLSAWVLPWDRAYSINAWMAGGGQPGDLGRGQCRGWESVGQGIDRRGCHYRDLRGAQAGKLRRGQHCQLAQAASWVSNISCALIESTDDGSTSTPLTYGVDYVAAAGVYTFTTAYADVFVSITYHYNAINSVSAKITLLHGTYPQSPWSYLTSLFPSQAIGYQGVACAAAINWDLGSSTGMPNLTFDTVACCRLTQASAVAMAVAQNILQNSLYVRNTYTFKLGWEYCLLEPTDYVTLTDLGAGLDHTPVRITSIEEDEGGLLSIEAEDAPPGISSHALYPHQEVGGYAAEYNLPSGSINTPVIFDAPWSLTANGHEIWVAASGGVNYGGCSVWLSANGTNYKCVGRIIGPARHGFLTAPMAAGTDPDTAHSCQVDLSESAGVLVSGSTADADHRGTLAWADGEFIAYSTATLTGSYPVGPSFF
ncbi:MAG: hypothetical protein HQL87_17325 [Magnetococcales bacterium]|nr:hypothetical protein [Magnetococcales bacterium]